MKNYDFTKLIDEIKNGKYTDAELTYMSKQFKEVVAELNSAMDSNVQSLSVNMWIVQTNPIVKDRVVSDVYKQYVNWCKMANVKEETIIMFGKYIYRTLGLTNKVVNVKGKSVRKYVRV